MGENDKIEITDKMIDAGAEALVERYGGLDLSPSPSAVAREVFWAMHAAGRSRRQSTRAE